MNDVKNLTVLDFKKEQLVNLNDEEMFKVKGGAGTTMNCVRATIKAIKETWKVTGYTQVIYELMRGDETPPPFQVTDNYLGADVTCASSPELTVYG